MIPTGFKKLDYSFLGWKSGELIIIGIGQFHRKTPFMFSIINQISKNHKTILFSLDYTKLQLENVFECFRTKKSRYDYLGNLFIRGSINLRFNIDDTSTLSISMLKEKLTRLVKKEDVEIIFIDYLQLITIDNYKEDRKEEITKIQQELKKIAKEINIPIVLFSDLDYNSHDELHTDFFDSNSVGLSKKYADIILFIYLPRRWRYENAIKSKDNIMYENFLYNPDKKEEVICFIEKHNRNKKLNGEHIQLMSNEFGFYD